jgi:hypothetical protein
VVALLLILFKEDHVFQGLCGGGHLRYVRVRAAALCRFWLEGGRGNYLCRHSRMLAAAAAGAGKKSKAAAGAGAKMPAGEDKEIAGLVALIERLTGQHLPGKKARQIYEASKATTQCNNVIGEFVNGRPCYICGLEIYNINVATGNPLDTTNGFYPECDHLLPISEAIMWLQLYSPQFVEHPWYQKHLIKYEYGWAHRACNQIKSASNFIIRTESEFSVNYIKLKKLLSKIWNTSIESYAYFKGKLHARYGDKNNFISERLQHLIKPFQDICDYLNTFNAPNFLLLIGVIRVLHGPKSESGMDLFRNINTVEVDRRKEIADTLKREKAETIYTSVYNNILNIIKNKPQTRDYRDKITEEFNKQTSVIKGLFLNKFMELQSHQWYILEKDIECVLSYEMIQLIKGIIEKNKNGRSGAISIPHTCTEEKYKKIYTDIGINVSNKHVNINLFRKNLSENEIKAISQLAKLSVIGTEFDNAGISQDEASEMATIMPVEDIDELFVDISGSSPEQVAGKAILLQEVLEMIDTESTNNSMKVEAVSSDEAQAAARNLRAAEREKRAAEREKRAAERAEIEREKNAAIANAATKAIRAPEEEPTAAAEAEKAAIEAEEAVAALQALYARGSVAATTNATVAAIAAMLGALGAAETAEEEAEEIDAAPAAGGAGAARQATAARKAANRATKSANKVVSAIVGAEKARAERAERRAAEAEVRSAAEVAARRAVEAEEAAAAVRALRAGGNVAATINAAIRAAEAAAKAAAKAAEAAKAVAKAIIMALAAGAKVDGRVETARQAVTSARKAVEEVMAVATTVLKKGSHVFSSNAIREARLVEAAATQAAAATEAATQAVQAAEAPAAAAPAAAAPAAAASQLSGKKRHSRGGGTRKIPKRTMRKRKQTRRRRR